LEKPLHDATTQSARHPTDGTMMQHTQEVITILGDVLSLGERSALLRNESQLLGAIPELDSMAVISLLTALEDHFGITVNDDEISSSTFETVGTLSAYVRQKMGE
jgi:acyl carrier protein